MCDVEHAREDVVYHPRAHGRRGGGECFSEEGPRVQADTECATSQEDRNDGRADDFELAIPVRVPFRRGLARQTPAEQGDDVADEVLRGHIYDELSGEQARSEGDSPPAQWPASASRAAEFMYHPAAPFAPVRTTLDASPTSVILLPRSPRKDVEKEFYDTRTRT